MPATIWNDYSSRDIATRSAYNAHADALARLTWWEERYAEAVRRARSPRCREVAETSQAVDAANVALAVAYRHLCDMREGR